MPRNNSRVAGLALLFSCATQPREPAVERGRDGLAPGVPQSAAQEAPRPPTVSITNVAPGRFLLEADAPIQVATAATLQHRSPDGTWLPIPYELKDSCTPPAAGAARCKEILPGAAFSPLSWNGTACGPCCADQEDTPIDPGAYRLVLGTCDGQGHAWEGPPFEAPASTDVLERWRATSNVEKVSVFRLGRDLRFKRQGDGYILGDPIVAGSEVEVPPKAVQLLIEWLRDPRAFSYDFNRRCSPGQSFGFRLKRNVPGIGLERSEIAVDLRCASIAVENQEGALRQRSFSYFEESRAALLAVLREALPSTKLEGLRDR
jgi:hypothetical protein